jgi:hypothetical protein
MPLEIKNRRSTPRAKFGQTIRIRSFESPPRDEICTTINVSRRGIYFVTSASHYYAGMDVAVTRNFNLNDVLNREENGEVTRVEKRPDGQWGIAIRLLGPRQ